MKRYVGWLILCLGLASVAVERPHLVRHWGLYVVSTAHGTAPRSEHLFLDPFPDQIACKMEVQNLASEGAPAVCHSWLTMALATGSEQTLTSDFSGTNLLYSLYCRLRGIAAPPGAVR